MAAYGYPGCTRVPDARLAELEEYCKIHELPRSITDLITYLWLIVGVCCRCGSDSGNCLFDLLPRTRYDSCIVAEKKDFYGGGWERDTFGTGLCVDCTFKCCLRVCRLRVFSTVGLCTNEHPVTRDDRYCPDCKIVVERATRARCGTYRG